MTDENVMNCAGESPLRLVDCAFSDLRIYFRDDRHALKEIDLIAGSIAISIYEIGIQERRKQADIVRAACVCRDINDAGEQYTHENADGATALATLMSMLPETEEQSP